MEEKKRRSVYAWATRFKRKYSFTIAARIKKHSQIIERILDRDEEVLYAFCGQKNDSNVSLFQSCVVALTNKRIIIGQNRVVYGYFITSITPDLFNDLKIHSSLFWGSVIIDTNKELVHISNLDKASLDEIETRVNRIITEDKLRLRTKKEISEEKEEVTEEKKEDESSEQEEK
jgi:hypothetical protein